MAVSAQVQQKAKEYFSTLNPLAEKISTDISDIADAYSNLWTTFSPDEQNEMLDVKLIKPNLILKYMDDIKNERNLKKRRSSAMLSKDDATIITDTDSNNDRLSLSSSSNSNSYRSNDFSHIYLYNGKDLCTYSQIITALRYNQDDLCGIYRDEHSEPFNSKTKSQMNLNFGNAADANAKLVERAQKKFPEIKLPFVNGFDTIDGVMKKGGVDHVPELCAKLASLNNSNTLEHGKDGSVVRKSFMTRLFSGKGQTLPATVPSPKSTIVPAPLDSLSGIDLGISDSAKNFDSMSTKSASSSKPDEANDMSRLIDTNDDDNDINILNTSTDYDFLNNW